LLLVKRTSTRSGPVSCRSSEYPEAGLVDTIDNAPFSTLTVTLPPSDVNVRVVGATGADVGVPVPGPLVDCGEVVGTALGAEVVLVVPFGTDEFAAGTRTCRGSEPPDASITVPTPMIATTAAAVPAARTSWWRRLARR
jgi:hypothetical protein